MYEDIEAVLDEHVRPLLRTHGGEMEIIEVEDGVVRFKLISAPAVRRPIRPPRS